MATLFLNKELLFWNNTFNLKRERRKKKRNLKLKLLKAKCWKMVWTFWNVSLRSWKASLESYLPFNHNLGLAIPFFRTAGQIQLLHLANSQILSLQSHYTDPAQNNQNFKNPQFCFSNCYYSRPPAYNQHTFKRNMKTLNFLFSFTA